MDPIVVASIMSTVTRFAVSTTVDASVQAGLKVLAERAQRDTNLQRELDLLLAREETGSQAEEVRDCVEIWCARMGDCQGSAADLFADAIVAAARIENSSLGSRNAQQLRNQTTVRDIAAFLSRWRQQANAANPKPAVAHVATGAGRPLKALQETATNQAVGTLATRTADHTPLDTAQIMWSASKGDRWAWERLVDQYSRLIWAITRDFKLTENDASDVAQTTWLRLLENIHKIENPYRVGSWLAATARIECLRTLAVRKRVVLADDIVLEAAITPEPEADERSQMIREAMVREAMAQLPRRWQEMLELLMADPPASYAEISDRLGLPIGSIGPTRGRCLARLRALLPTPDGATGQVDVGGARGA